MKTKAMDLTKATLLALLVGNSQQAATAVKDTNFPRWPGSLILFSASTTCGTTDTGYYHLRASGVYGVPQVISGTEIGAQPDSTRSFWTDGIAVTDCA